MAPVKKLRNFETIGLPGPRIVVPPLKNPIEKITRATAEATDEGVLVKWDHPVPEDAIKGYQITRKIRQGRGTARGEVQEKIEKLVPEGRRWFLDKEASRKYAGKYLAYDVLPVTGDYRRNRMKGTWTRRDIKIPQLPAAPPAAPKEFTAKLETAGGKRAVICKWKDAKAENILKYMVQKYKPDKGYWGFFASAKSAPCRKELDGKRPETLRLRVVAVGEGGVKGGPSNKVTVEVPPAEKIQTDEVELRVDTRKSGRIRFSWHSPPEQYYIAGFRLYADGRLIADENELDGNTCYYTSWDYHADDSEFKLIVVDRWGRTGRPVVSTRPGDSAESLKKRSASGAKQVRVVRRYDDGTVYSKREFLRWRDGKKVKHGRQLYYHRNGRVRNDSGYKLGRLHGVSRYFDAEGILKDVSVYLDGRRVSYGEYREKNKCDDITAEDINWLKAAGEIK